MTTIRQLAERIRDTHSGGAKTHAEEIINLLDKAQHATMVGTEYGDYCCDCGTPIRTWHPSWEKHGWSLSQADIVGRFIPDPEPR